MITCTSPPCPSDVVVTVEPREILISSPTISIAPAS
jgi:hypothetical protein